MINAKNLMYIISTEKKMTLHDSLILYVFHD
jgi:hypothetical protein